MPTITETARGCALDRRTIVSGLALLPFCGAASAGFTGELTFCALPKAAWVWDFSLQRAREIADLARRYGITTLYASVPIAERAKLLGGDAELIRQLEDFRVRGIALWAAAGDPTWVNQPAILANPLRMLLDIQGRHGLFAGLHLDVEPHALPAWRSGEPERAALAGQLVAFLRFVRSQAGGMPIDFAAHPMLTGITLPSTGNALAAVCRHVDSISLMAYRNSAAATLRLAGTALDVIETSGTQWRMGVLVYAATEKQTTYAGIASEKFTTEISNLHLLMKNRPKLTFYKGIAIEDMRGLCALLST